MAKYKTFSFMDQFFPTTIDLTDFIKKFSTDEYKIEFSNYQPLVVTTVNLFEQISFDFKKSAQNIAFEHYVIQEGEKIEAVARKFYGDNDYWWVIILLNEMKVPLFDWPMNDDQLKELSALLVKKENKYTYKTYYKLLFEQNEDKRAIILLKPQHVDSLVEAFRSYFYEIQGIRM